MLNVLFITLWNSSEMQGVHILVFVFTAIFQVKDQDFFYAHSFSPKFIQIFERECFYFTQITYIKQHDYCTGTPWAVHYKRRL